MCSVLHGLAQDSALVPKGCISTCSNVLLSVVVAHLVTRSLKLEACISLCEMHTGVSGKPSNLDGIGPDSPCWQPSISYNIALVNYDMQ